MTSKERLLTTLRGEIPDRVPISCYELVGYDTQNFCNQEPSYQSLMEMIRQKSDCLCMWNPTSDEKLALSAVDPHISTQRKELPDGYEITSTFCQNGTTLTQRARWINGVYTRWITEHWCKDTDDVDAMLSIPFQPVTFSQDDVARINSELGDHGILLPSIPDAACMAMELMEFGDAMVWATTETEHFAQTVAEFHRRNMINLERMLQTTPGDLYRIYGPEYLCPPYLPPKFFEQFAFPYLCEMVELIHKYGRMARIHSHGRIGKVLDMMVATGCDGIDPCEEIPDGDTTLEELKARAGDKLTLFGSMQLKLLEKGSVADVIRETKRMVLTGKPGGRFVLMPTAAPINVPLSPQTEENYRAFLDTALEYGAY